jgi:hypothetical protein
MTKEQSVKEILANNPELNTSPHEASNTSSTEETCCWSWILSLQSDFVAEQPLLQSTIEDSGHICLLITKISLQTQSH